MTRKIVHLVVSLLLTGGIALAQQPATPRQPAPNEPFGGVFSMLLDGGSYLGIEIEDINKTNISNYGLREVRGIGITEVEKNSPAEKAGLKKGDVILRFDNESINSTRKLTRMVSETAPDHSVKIEISRGGSEQAVTVTLAKREDMSDTIFQRTPGTPGSIFQTTPFPGFPQTEQDRDGLVFSFGNNRRIGVTTQPLTKQLADYFGVADGKGVLVTSVAEGSPAAKAGVKAGDVITAIDGERVEGAGDLSRAINKQKDGDVTLTIVRDKGPRTIKVTPEKTQGTLMRSGRLGSQRVIRDQMRDAILQGIGQGRIVIPQIDLPAIPAINVTVPRIELPSIPAVDIVIPTPKVRVVHRVRVVI